MIVELDSDINLHIYFNECYHYFPQKRMNNFVEMSLFSVGTNNFIEIQKFSPGPCHIGFSFFFSTKYYQTFF